MDNSYIFAHVDHTLLKAYSSRDEITALCNEAITFKTASVCIPPNYVKAVSEKFPSLNICTVIGFPLGYNTASSKLCELEEALLCGANEFDMVVNLTDVKNKLFTSITNEISALKESAGNKILKVIIETCYLTEAEKIELCKCVTDGHADFIKTSTGFGTGGAVLSDIELMKKHIGCNVKIKAAGGVHTRNDMIAFLEAGCERIGTSSAIKILSGEANGDY